MDALGPDQLHDVHDEPGPVVDLGITAPHIGDLRDVLEGRRIVHRRLEVPDDANGGVGTDHPRGVEGRIDRPRNDVAGVRGQGRDPRRVVARPGRHHPVAIPARRAAPGSGLPPAMFSGGRVEGIEATVRDGVRQHQIARDHRVGLDAPASPLVQRRSPVVASTATNR